MVYNIYSIYDSVAEEYGPIFNAKSDAVAKRAVSGILNSGEIRSNDYDLYCLGTYNTDTGEINSEVVYVGNCRYIVADFAGEGNDNE